MQQPNNYAPFKVDSEQPDRKFEVQENGDVKMTEVVKSVVWFHGREFLSFHRQHIKDKEILEESLTQKTLDKVKKDIKNYESTIKKIDPFIKDVEIKLKKAYEQQVLDGKVNGLKAELAKKSDRRPGFAEAIWYNLKDEDKSKVLEKLSDFEKQEVVKFKVLEKKKQRGKK